MTDYIALANQAAELDDQTETKTAVEFTPPSAGVTVGRMIEYIELGKQPQRPFKGKAKPNAFMVRIVFELLHPERNIKEIEVDGVKKKIADKIPVTLAYKLDAKASYKRLFNTMVRGRDGIKHMAQMLNEPFVITVVHNTGADGRTYANIRLADGSWLLQEAAQSDPIAGTKTAIRVPAAISPIRIFLWNKPTKETWDSLYIDGTRTVKEGDVEKEVSKNWIQEKILSAKNYDGSELQAMLANLSTPIDEDYLPIEGGADIALDVLDKMNDTGVSEVDALAALGLN